MTQLTVTSTRSMGPLEVTVYPPVGEPIEFVLSAGTTQTTVQVLPGRYTIVARRPNGTRLRRATVVGIEGAIVTLASEISPALNDFMQPEVDRGELIRLKEATSMVLRGAPLSGAKSSLQGSAIRAKEAFSHQDGSVGSSIPLSLPPPIAPAGERRLIGFRLNQGRWSDGFDLDNLSSEDFVKNIWRSEQLVKISLAPNPGEIISVGFLDRTSFGPLVNIAPFANRVEISFILKSVVAQASDRAESAGHRRVPAALVTLGEPAVADLLSAFAAPTPSSFTSFQTLWDQAAQEFAPDSGGDVGAALEMLVHKYQRPVEAIVAAHYLLRYTPEKMPLSWAENLVKAMPLAADGPMIAAWTWILNRPKNASDEEVEQAVERYVSTALERPAVLFARTRQLLLEARHFSSDHVTPDLGLNRKRWAEQELYDRAGAAASGLECYWGYTPSQPSIAPSPHNGLQLLPTGPNAFYLLDKSEAINKRSRENDYPTSHIPPRAINRPTSHPYVLNSTQLEENYTANIDISDVTLANEVAAINSMSSTRIFSNSIRFLSYPIRLDWAIKRALDIIGSSVLLFLLFPLIFLIALMIYFGDGKPPIFLHMRLGRDGRPFRLLRLRTMVVDGEAVLAAHLAADPRARAEWAETHKLSHDPRITPIGKILRKTGLDALPQLWNVLRGEMSLVGPRPIVPAEVARYGRAFSVCFAVPPGITGLWQVSGRSDTTYAERVALDLDYATRWSLRRDLAIMLRAVPSLLSGRGSR